MISLARRFSVTEARVLGQRLPYPLSPCPPIAIFSPYFSLEPPAIEVEHPSELTTAGVHTIAAPLSFLYRINPSLWTPEYPLVVFSHVDRGLMTEEDRDRLWEDFGVPVFEYLLNEAGRILAEECEAHDGLHLQSGDDELDGMITREACPCGRSTPRLLTLDAIIEESFAESLN